MPDFGKQAVAPGTPRSPEDVRSLRRRSASEPKPETPKRSDKAAASTRRDPVRTERSGTRTEGSRNATNTASRGARRRQRGSRTSGGDRVSSRKIVRAHRPLWREPVVLGLIGFFMAGLIGGSVWLSLRGGSDRPSTGHSATADSQPLRNDSTDIEAVQIAGTGRTENMQTQLAADGSRTEPDTNDAAGAGARQEPSIERTAVLTSGAPSASPAGFSDRLLPFLATHCSDCHNSDDPMGGINVTSLKSPEELRSGRRSWEKVYAMIRNGAMPPGDYSPQPSEDSRNAAAEVLRSGLYDIDCSVVDNPGRPGLRRLNRTEYNNTVSDLFGMPLTPADNFPSDDVGEGFDNIGDVLTLPPLLLEKYLDAAEAVTAAVIDTRDYSRGKTERRSAEELTDDSGRTRVAEFGRVLATNGEVRAEFTVGVKGTYEITTMLAADQAGREDAAAEILVDGKVRRRTRVSGNRVSSEYRFETDLAPGAHRIAVAFTNDFYDPNAPGGRQDRNLAVEFIELTGPLNAEPPARSPGHEAVIVARPNDSVTPQAAAEKIFRPLLRRAFRRTAREDEVKRFADLTAELASDAQTSWDQAVAVAVQAMLVSPEFLFRTEQDPPAGRSSRALSSAEVASRLSYFLWSSMPDEELLQLAEQDKLTDPQILTSQVRRMLRSEKADAVVTNFASQWLNLRNLAEVSPNPEVFPTFSDELRADMLKETEMVVAAVMREDRSALDLLSADFTFVNKRLAEHYSLSGIRSDEFTRVSLSGTPRSGILTHAAVLTLTSNPERTSPVKRGKWIMENLLGESPPPPPPDVPLLEETAAVNPDASLADQLAQHRADPGCAACHKVMDPLGLGFENFDAVGRWRSEEKGRPIEIRGEIPGMGSFSGPQDIAAMIRRRKTDFLRTLTRKLLTYATGRGLHYYDECAVDEILAAAEPENYRLRVLIEGVVLSDPFLKRASAAAVSDD